MIGLGADSFLKMFLFMSPLTEKDLEGCFRLLRGVSDYLVAQEFCVCH